MDVCTCTCDPSISAHPIVTTTVNLADGKLAKGDEKLQADICKHSSVAGYLVYKSLYLLFSMSLLSL